MWSEAERQRRLVTAAAAQPKIVRSGAAQRLKNDDVFHASGKYSYHIEFPQGISMQCGADPAGAVGWLNPEPRTWARDFNNADERDADAMRTLSC